MVRASVADLIKVSPEAAGVGTDREEIRRQVYCTVKSIGQTEKYMALGQGLNPEVKVILDHEFEYDDEPLCELEGILYDIKRTYVTDSDSIELTLQRVTRNAKAVT